MADAIRTAPSALLKAFEILLFDRMVNADQRQGLLTDAQADEIKALVRWL